MKKNMTVCEPRISNALLTNPGIGFIAAPGLMEVSPDEIRDNRGKPVAPYRFTPDSKTWNHPDSGVYYCGGRWRDIEIEEGVFDWSSMDAKLAKWTKWVALIFVVLTLSLSLLPH